MTVSSFRPQCKHPELPFPSLISDFQPASGCLFHAYNEVHVSIKPFLREKQDVSAHILLQIHKASTRPVQNGPQFHSAAHSSSNTSQA